MAARQDAVGTEAMADEAKSREQLLAELTALRQTLRDAEARLSDADSYKDQFLAVMSHELRTPLTVISGYASMLDDEIAGTLNDEQHLFLGKILGGADRMLILVTNLLDLSRMQAGRFLLDRSPLDFAELVGEAVALMRPLADAKRIVLEAEVDVDGAPALDRQRVLQILTNLLSNAIKFTPEGGQVQVLATVKDGHVATEVRDTGLGIAERDLPKLFRKFGQLDMSSTRHADGAGLGLALCKHMVEAHGGAIGVTSQLGAGSTFWFTLPWELGDAANF